MKLAYFDCFSGVSGDMILGALVDSGLSLEKLRKALSGLALKGYTLKARTVQKADLRATKVDVLTDAASSRLKIPADLEKVIRRSRLGLPIRERSLKVLDRLIRAEAKVHGVSSNRLQFHGMDPVDTLVDIAGAVAGLEILGIQQIVSSPIPVGTGMKGLTPATAELLKGVPIYSSGISRELTTPTGAAILTALARDFSPIPPLSLHSVGYGAGTYELAQQPNLLRILIGEPLADQHAYETDQITEIETNLDDLSPQLYEHLMERLLAAGALDVYFTPIVMKKSRPAVKLSVLASRPHVGGILNLIFSESTTLGIRMHEAVRAKLPRAERTVSTRFGKVRVKVVKREGRRIDTFPEYSDCKEIALRTGLPLRTVMDQVKQEVQKAAGQFPSKEGHP